MRVVRVLSGVVGAALVLAGCDSPDRDPVRDPDRVSVTELTLTVGSDQRDVPLSGVTCEELGEAIAIRSRGPLPLSVVAGPAGSSLVFTLKGLTWYTATLAESGGNHPGFDALSGALDDLPITRSGDTFTLDRVPVVNHGRSGSLSGTLWCPAVLRADGSGASLLTLDGDADDRLAINEVACLPRYYGVAVVATNTLGQGVATIEVKNDGTAAVHVDLASEEDWSNPAWTDLHDLVDTRFEPLPVTISGATVTLDHVPVVNRDGDDGTGTVTGTLPCAAGRA